ncbi:MAG: Bifunctional NAD(P)H-hydrate repair enzyme Nnr [Elusimicrobia bacterium]|nr:Bifunctional NAD(P)H-hydrate repair enzyme Nnr [Elusimicrobiota bacterium]
MTSLITRAIARRWLKRRAKDAHKGTSGRVLVVAGSKGMVGAAVLCATAAMRSGAGLVKLATVKSQQRVAVGRAPLEITTLGLPEDAQGRMASSAWTVLKKTILHWRPQVVALGPGLGESAAVRRLVKRILGSPSISVVVDADGFRALLMMKRSQIRARLIMTPHEGEMARLMKVTSAQVKARREYFAREAAKKFGGICVLKGPGTLVTDGRLVWKNTTGNPGMASGGMGDVLTGMLAALWAPGDLTAEKAAAMGVYLHGLAGDLALKKKSERSLLASDLISSIPKAFEKVWRDL